MWRTMVIAAAACIGGAVAMGQTSTPDEARQVFDMHYGPKIAAVAATVDTSDDAALAAQLIEDTKLAQGQPALVVLLYEAAAELGQRHVNGYPAAIEALRKLLELTPDKTESLRGTLTDLLQKQYVRLRGEERTVAGDQLLSLLRLSASDFAAKNDYAKAVAAARRASSLATQMNSDQREPIRRELESLMHRQRVSDQIAQLRTSLEANPSDTAQVDRLIRLFVVDLDDPASGARYVMIAGDLDLKRLVPLLAGPIEQVPADELVAAGEWYRDQASRAATVIQPALLTRAKTYLQRYVDQSQEQDLQRVRAELALRDVNEKLAALGPVAPPTPVAATKGIAFNGVRVTFEAEKAESVRDPMKVERGGSASGGAFVWEEVSSDEIGTPGGRFGRRVTDRIRQGLGNLAGAGSVTYLIDAKEAGDYYLWARVRTADEANDSFFLMVTPGESSADPQAAAPQPGRRGFPAVNGQGATPQVWSMGVRRNWTWVPFGPSRDGTEAATIKLEQGLNTITIAVREPGAMLDALHISKARTAP